MHLDRPPQRKKRPSLTSVAALAAAFAAASSLAGCAGRQVGADKPDKPDKNDELDALRTQLSELRSMMTHLGSRLDSVDTRLGSLSDKVNQNQSRLDLWTANQKAVPSAVDAHPSEGSGTDPRTLPASDDPEAGFVSDGAAQAYRKASILLAARKYPEAVLAFSSFVEKYPDHPLAGNAQFYVGDAYFKEKEYRLALSEFERVLTSYDRSAHVADTLREMAEAEEQLKLPEQAARHRQLLTSLFAQSPAANFNSTHSGTESDPAPSMTTPSAASQSTALHPKEELPTAPMTPQSTPASSGRPPEEP